MMSACPNCRSQVFDEHLFCRTCGYRLDSFQMSTRALAIPPAERLPLTAYMPRSYAGQNKPRSWRTALPIAAFFMALMLGGLSVAFVGESTPYYATQSVTPFNIFAERSYIGVYIVTPYSGEQGALVDTVLDASPADRAGLLSGDRIVAVNGKYVHSPREMVNVMKYIATGSYIHLDVIRDGEKLVLPVTTVNRSMLRFNSMQGYGFLGVDNLDSTVVDFDTSDNEVTEGVYVGSVVNNSAAESAGLQAGDVIIGVDGKSTRTPTELRQRIRATRPDQNVIVTIERDGEVMMLDTVMGSRN